MDGEHISSVSSGKISEGFEKKAIGCYIHLSIFSFGKLCKIDHYMHTHALLKLLLLYSTCSINIEQAKIIDNVFLLVVLGSYSPCKCNIYKFCNNYKIIICDRVRGNQPYAIKIDFEIRAP